MDIELFINQILNGLNAGSIYALVAVGYTMVYGIIRLINFAHGEFFAAGGYIDVRTGAAQDANSIPIPKVLADEVFDAAACIGCGACVAACKNASAMLFVAAKASHLNMLPQGKVKIEVESKLVDRIGGPMDVTLRVNGAVVGQGKVPVAMSLHFTSNATFDIGIDRDSPVSLDYYDEAPEDR